VHPLNQSPLDCVWEFTRATYAGSAEKMREAAQSHCVFLWRTATEEGVVYSLGDTSGTGISIDHAFSIPNLDRDGCTSWAVAVHQTFATRFVLIVCCFAGNIIYIIYIIYIVLTRQ
jgi:hypothetical protein